MINPENDPRIINTLAQNFGLSSAVRFHQIDFFKYNLENMIDALQVPTIALLVRFPLTKTWKNDRRVRDEAQNPYQGGGPDEPVIWFKETIGNSSGALGLLHCLLNGGARDYILPGSILARLYTESIPLVAEKRAKMLYDDVEFEGAHQTVTKHCGLQPPKTKEQDEESEERRQSIAKSLNMKPLIEVGQSITQHFVAFVKGDDGYLWELDGSRPGPIRRGLLQVDNDDLLHEKALRISLWTILQRNCSSGEGTLPFTCLALGRDTRVAVRLPMNDLQRGSSVRDEGVARQSLFDPSYSFEDSGSLWEEWERKKGKKSQKEYEKYRID